MDDEEDILPLKSKDQEGFKDWIVRTMALWLDSPSEEINPDHDFANCALDSVAAMRLLGMLEILMDQPMDPYIFAKYPSPTLLAGYLSDLAETA
jgi:acyl carrier protein